MPTSLTYIILVPEALHLGDLMRIWVRPATKITMPPSDFQGPTRAYRTPQEGWCFTEARPLSPDNPIPGVVAVLTKKRKLFPELLPTSPSSFALPRLMMPVTYKHIHPKAHASMQAHIHHLSPWAGSGILTRFPFAPRGCQLIYIHTHTHTRTHMHSAMLNTETYKAPHDSVPSHRIA